VASERRDSVNQGDYVRHTARPEWGVGRVLMVSGDYLQIQFQHALVPLKASVAGPLLTKSTASEFQEPASSPRRRGRTII
jgi:hypothetical protein